MAEEETSGKNVALTLPIGALGAALALGLAAAAYTYLSGSSEDSGESGNSKGKSGSMRKKLGLMTIITLLENDATRKVVLAVLKAMARRA
jgi:hypothetical protein